MFLRPRHVSAVPATTTPATASQGKALDVSLEDGVPHHRLLSQEHDQCVSSLPPEASNNDNNHYYPRRSPQSKLRARTPAPRRAVVWICYVGCFAVLSVFLFAWLRTMAIARVAAEYGTDPLRTSGTTAAAAMFTVLVNTFERPRQLEEAIRHYAQCDGVDSVRVAWSESSPPPDAATRPQLFDHPRPVRFHPYPTTSINNRFIPPSNLSTKAVFVVDDDIEVPCEHLLAAFWTWQRHPDTLVGFFPRSHAYRPPGREEKDGVWEYLYFWRVLWDMEYSMVLTKAAFLHAEYLELYSGVVGENFRGDNDDAIRDAAMVDAMVQTRAYVDSHRNCEDIAMQMVVASVSGLPPVAAFAPVVDVGLVGGISTAEGRGKWWQAPHAMKRSRCLRDLHEIFCTALTAAAPPSTAKLRPHHTTSTEEQPEHCEILIRTDLFAISPPGGGGVGDGGDLARISRWALAIRAPTLADFISADMLLVPGKVWKWLAKDDILGPTVE